MNDSDKKYYENRERERQSHMRAISKAKNRGEASVKWHETNKLTPETLSDFKKAMKQADKEWEQAIKEGRQK
jgi:hypothetical protein